MNVLARAALILTITASATTGLASTASAQTVAHNDARGDVLAIELGSEHGPAPEPVVAPDETVGDILRTVVDHRLRKVVLSVKYVELDPADPITHYVSMVTDESVRRDILVMPDPERPQGELIVINGSGNGVPCIGLERRIDYTANTLRMVIPRGCLSAPRWVRVGVGATRFHEPHPHSAQIFVDDANRDGSIGDAHPAYGVRVHRA